MRALHRTRDAVWLEVLTVVFAGVISVLLAYVRVQALQNAQSLKQKVQQVGMLGQLGSHNETLRR